MSGILGRDASSLFSLVWSVCLLCSWSLTGSLEFGCALMISIPPSRSRVTKPARRIRIEIYFGPRSPCVTLGIWHTQPVKKRHGVGGRKGGGCEYHCAFVALYVYAENMQMPPGRPSAGCNPAARNRRVRGRDPCSKKVSSDLLRCERYLRGWSGG
ncbi:hypothetical protein QBC36DRAFT_332932 [Triangularia setosa]|uniref:Secreted protein n=1 Tax=Triangularia setosa TaxID=2587417 RepID=A0AAN7A470_9PEZI|nr:hypothetical protein QBC36DRAFT_332932 [Podospora setosa]